MMQKMEMQRKIIIIIIVVVVVNTQTKFYFNRMSQIDHEIKFLVCDESSFRVPKANWISSAAI